MYKLSSKSMAVVTSCCPQLVTICLDLIKIFDYSAICGHRSLKDQQEAYNAGNSKVKVSKHNLIPSEAIDIYPYPIPKNLDVLRSEDIKRFYYMAGLFKGIAHKHGISIRWGGDWNSNNVFSDQTFNDLGHFEVIK